MFLAKRDMLFTVLSSHLWIKHTAFIKKVKELWDSLVFSATTTTLLKKVVQSLSIASKVLMLWMDFNIFYQLKTSSIWILVVRQWEGTV